MDDGSTFARRAGQITDAKWSADIFVAINWHPPQHERGCSLHGAESMRTTVSERFMSA
jgi:hypothetical protein